jgi:hypothetical protein
MKRSRRSPSGKAVDVRFEANDLWDVAPERAKSLETLIRDVVGRASPSGPVTCHLVRDLRDPERARVRLEAPGWQSSGAFLLRALASGVRQAIADLIPTEGHRGPSDRLAEEWRAMGLPPRPIRSSSAG